ncbi:RdgB/HAM1 family non-canonical purine NTP pyrophosphatase [Oenococcus alcoholitolerans]|uniref:RdgB/HAM1 family non-canonical purine NTP pyrophosphatase n=1 Tax=Oenococcus alcoholitolerans TaxID=931074 RepID=UPI003F6E7F75
MNKIIFATKNAGKSKEVKELLGDSFEISDLNQLAPLPEIKETGHSFLENARIKAKTIAPFFPDQAVLAEDTGLCIDALGGRPGIFSARYAGDHDDLANIKKVLTEMEGIPVDKRGAHFETAMVFIYQGKEIDAFGRSDGRILNGTLGQDGFGYDPIFYSTDLEKTFAEADESEKNSVSHRFRALNNLISQIKLK